MDSRLCALPVRDDNKAPDDSTPLPCSLREDIETTRPVSASVTTDLVSHGIFRHPSAGPRRYKCVTVRSRISKEFAIERENPTYSQGSDHRHSTG